MKKAHLAWLLGGALVMATGAVNVIACSSDSSGTPSGGDASTSDGSSPLPDGSTSGADSGGSSDAGADADADADAGIACSASPSLRQNTPGDIACAFDGGVVCPTSQQCCVGQGQPDKCATWGTACDNPVGGGLAVECAQKSDCTANGNVGVCCLVGAQPALNAACGYSEATSGTGTTCKNSCAAADSQLCSSDADCPQGRVCRPFLWKNLQLGFCD